MDTSAAAMAQRLMSGSAVIERVDKGDLPPPIFSVDLVERLEQEFPERAPKEGETIEQYHMHLGKRELIKTIRFWSKESNENE